MNLGTYTPSQHELDLINKHQFSISVSGDRFVCRHPRFKKLGKIEGGSLTNVIYEMAEAERKLLAHPKYAKLVQDGAVTPDTDPNLGTNVVPFTPSPEPQSDPDEIHNVVLDDSGGKPQRQPKPKSTGRDPEKMAFLQAFKLWLLEPNADPDKIYKKLTDMGIGTTLSSVRMLRHMGATHLRAMTELGFVTVDGVKARREEIANKC